jgi:DnaK suppressor protein
MCEDHGLRIDVEAIRRRLEMERAELLAKAGLPAVSNPLTPDERDSDEADAAVTTDLRERAMWLAQDSRQKLELIQQALRRLDDGTYGRCLVCGGPINPERLEALPYATQCIHCQQQADRRGRRVRGRERMDG